MFLSRLQAWGVASHGVRIKHSVWSGAFSTAFMYSDAEDLAHSAKGFLRHHSTSLVRSASGSVALQRGPCQHGRKRSYYCKDCNGAGVCEHGRARHQCKFCGGASVCEHERLKHQCKDCRGTGICEHGRSKYQCKDCRGAIRCEHGRVRNSCRDCGGARPASIFSRLLTC